MAFGNTQAITSVYHYSELASHRDAGKVRTDISPVSEVVHPILATISSNVSTSNAILATTGAGTKDGTGVQVQTSISSVQSPKGLVSSPVSVLPIVLPIVLHDETLTSPITVPQIPKSFEHEKTLELASTEVSQLTSQISHSESLSSLTSGEALTSPFIVSPPPVMTSPPPEDTQPTVSLKEPPKKANANQKQIKALKEQIKNLEEEVKNAQSDYEALQYLLKKRNITFSKETFDENHDLLMEAFTRSFNISQGVKFATHRFKKELSGLELEIAILHHMLKGTSNEMFLKAQKELAESTSIEALHYQLHKLNYQLQNLLRENEVYKKFFNENLYKISRGDLDVAKNELLLKSSSSSSS